MPRTANGEEADGISGSNFSAVVLYSKKTLHHWTMNLTESTAWTVYSSILPGCYKEENKTGGKHWASVDPLVLLLFKFCHCSCCPKASSSISLYWTVESILIPGQDSSLGSIPTQTPCTPKTGTLGMPPVVLTVLVSPRSGFKCTSPNISNIDRAISLKGQHWSLLYTRCGGYLY